MRIREVSVTGTTKGWGEFGNTGKSSGTEVTYFGVPEDGEESWSLEEARAVALKLRHEIQKILVVDSKARGTNPPDQGMRTLEEYQTVLKQLPEVPWKDNVKSADKDE